MIPEAIDRYLKQHHLDYAHSMHPRAVPAQRLAAAEHITGARIAKPVVVSIDGRLALAVVPASARVDLPALAAAAGAEVAELVPESMFVDHFQPCEPGAEPAIGLFGLPIFVDARLVGQPWIVMRGGTHEDSIRLDTRAWLTEERARVVRGLGMATA